MKDKIISLLSNDQDFANCSINKIKENSGYDNKTYILKEDNMVIRSNFNKKKSIHFLHSIRNEYKYLPIISTYLSYKVPMPIKIIEDIEDDTSILINQYIEGTHIYNKDVLLPNLISLFKQLIKIPITLFDNNMLPCLENFYRGGHISVYENDFIKSLDLLSNINSDLNLTDIRFIWNRGKNTVNKKVTFVHGDLWINNLLFDEDGILIGIIDFGQMAIGDLACDLQIIWMLFNREEIKYFANTMHFDDELLLRGACWTLWKMLLVISGQTSWQPGIVKPINVVKNILSFYKE